MRQIKPRPASPFGKISSADFDPDQSTEPLRIAKYKYRRAEARLAKYSSEMSTGVDLPRPTNLNLPMTHGGGTRSLPVHTPREETPGSTEREARVPAVLEGSWAMERFPVDIDPAQVVRWIMAEHAAAPFALKATARRATEVREIPARSEFHLGDEEREDLSELASIATLKIGPAHERDGWLLTVTLVAYRTVCVSLAMAQVSAAEQHIRTLGRSTFNEFIRPGRA